jgi:ubiquinone/menaquinone biosynthesis C-methylase UbiE
MTHEDHLALLRDGIPGRGGVWADLGSGTGAFTLALADIVGPESTIYSVDVDRRALKEQQRVMQARFPNVPVNYIAGDYMRPLKLPPLDGILMANSLHFQRDKAGVLRLIRGYLRPAGRLLLVEYNADSGNPWVPFPISYSSWEKLASANGFGSTSLLATVPSRFLREIYSAVSIKSEA